MRVEIKEMKELRLATLEHVGTYDRISEAFERLGEVAGRAGLVQPGTKMLAVYRDDPKTTPAEKLRSEAALVVAPDVVLPPGLGERRVPAGRYASTTHVGRYQALGETWTRFREEWLPQSGYHRGDGVSYEIYRNTPENAPEEKLTTDLYIPVKR